MVKSVCGIKSKYLQPQSGRERVENRFGSCANPPRLCCSTSRINICSDLRNLREPVRSEVASRQVCRKVKVKRPNLCVGLNRIIYRNGAKWKGKSRKPIRELR